MSYLHLRVNSLEHGGVLQHVWNDYKPVADSLSVCDLPELSQLTHMHNKLHRLTIYLLLLRVMTLMQQYISVQTVLHDTRHADVPYSATSDEDVL